MYAVYCGSSGYSSPHLAPRTASRQIPATMATLHTYAVRTYATLPARLFARRHCPGPEPRQRETIIASLGWKGLRGH